MYFWPTRFDGVFTTWQVYVTGYVTLAGLTAVGAVSVTEASGELSGLHRNCGTRERDRITLLLNVLPFSFVLKSTAKAVVIASAQRHSVT